MLCFWAAKGGVGASVVAAGCALARAAAGDRVLLVDLAGDLPAILGVERSTTGVAEWAAGGASVPADALDRLGQPVAPGLTLLERGDGPLEPARASAFWALLDARPDTVVVDAGTNPGPFAREVLGAATRSVVVTTACFVAIERTRAAAGAATDVVVHRQPERALRPADVEAALGLPVRAVVRHDPAVARAVDAGLLAARLPASLRRTLPDLAA